MSEDSPRVPALQSGLWRAERAVETCESEWRVLVARNDPGDRERIARKREELRKLRSIERQKRLAHDEREARIRARLT